MVRPHVKAYDFDGTLIKGDSFLYFILHALSPVRLIKGIVASLPVLMKWKVGKIDSSIAKERMFSHFFGGMTEKEVTEKARSFIPILDKKINHSVFESRGLKTDGKTAKCIVSASPGFWIRPWAEAHDFDLVIATEAEVREGKLTGRFSTPNCKGEEKVRRITEEFPDRRNYILEAWGNSTDDLEMLEFADVAHAVGKLKK